MLERLCWRTKEFQFDRISVGTSESHHLEVAAPQGTEIVWGAFAERPGRTGTLQHDVAGKNVSRVHLQLRELGPGASGTAAVRLRAQRGGFLYAAATAGIFNAAVLWLGFGRLGELQAEATAAILLIVPTFLAAYLARPGEHEMVSYFLSGVRVLLFASAVCLFVAAGAIAAGYPSEHRQQPAGQTQAATSQHGSTPDAKSDSVTGQRTTSVEDFWRPLRWIEATLALLLMLSCVQPLGQKAPKMGPTADH